MSSLEYEGSNFFRQRIILATVTGRSVKILNIRNMDQEPGIKDFEMTILKLMDEITNGSKIVVNETGTEVFYQPGLLTGGTVKMDCGTERCLSYFLELLICLGPFSRKSIKAVLTGVTNNRTEISAEAMRLSWIPILRKFILNDEELELKVTKRGLPPEGGGQVIFSCPAIRQLRPVQLTMEGKIKKMRGVAFACKVSPTMTTRMIEAAKSLLTPLLPNVFITADHRKGAGGGNSPGFGLTLTAETTEGCVFLGEGVSRPRGDTDDPLTPEDVGREAAENLLHEIYRGGCVDSKAQALSCLFMVLGQKDVSKLVSGPLSEYTVHMLRHIRDFMEINFKIEQYEHPALKDLEEEEEDPGLGSTEKLQLTCVGIGFVNLSKPVL